MQRHDPTGLRLSFWRAGNEAAGHWRRGQRPALRRNGGIRALFEEGLPRARREGYTFSALYPFSHVFYRKFGYELAQVSREAVLEPQALRDDLRGAAEISLVLPEDAEGRTAVRQVYEDYARERNLSLHRDDALWERKWKGATLEQMKYLYLLRDAAGTPWPIGWERWRRCMVA